MRRTDLLKGVGAFALVAVVVLGGTVAAGTLLSSPDDTSSPDASAFTADSLPASPIADDGTISAPGGEPKTVVVDLSHANAIEKGGIQPLVDALVSQGHTVRFYSGSAASSGLGGLSSQSGESAFNDTLRSADAFVVANPGTEYTSEEIAGVEAFTDAGGRVLVLADPLGSSSSSGTSLPAPLGSGSTASATPGQPTNLAAQFDVSFDAGYLYDMDENANHYRSVYASGAGDAPLTADAGRVVLQGAAGLTTGPDATPLFRAESTHRSSTRRAGNYTVAARSGNLTAIGDTDFLAPETATVADNERLVGNVAAFLVTGEKAPDAPTAGSESDGSSGGVSLPTGNTTTTSASP